MTVTSVPFFRPAMGDAEIASVVECIKSGWLTTGPNARAFEEEFTLFFVQLGFEVKDLRDRQRIF